MDAPTHVGFILDGNRRWAKKHGLPVYEGHLAGYNALKEVALETLKRGVKFLSVYSFSTENWGRDEEEITNIFKLMMRLFTTDIKFLLENDVRLVVLGSREGLDKKMIKAIDNAEKKTSHCQSGTLALCFNYGGQEEVAEAVRFMIDTKMPAGAITPAAIAEHLYHPEIPPLDIVVRTSGEQRISGFMLWRASYAEFLFLDKMWPEMTRTDVDDILDEYNKRTRRFGK